MKKIVLAAINAKYIHSNLAVYSLKANAGKYEEDIELAEYTINHQKMKFLPEFIEKSRMLSDFRAISGILSTCLMWLKI